MTNSGYMAPEYAMTGHFSEKSDVFSFGVIILEIVSGQKNKYYPRSQVQEALLHRVSLVIKCIRELKHKMIIILINTQL